MQNNFSFRNPTDDVPPRISEPVVAVPAEQAGDPDTVVQVAAQKDRAIDTIRPRLDDRC